MSLSEVIYKRSPKLLQELELGIYGFNRKRKRRSGIQSSYLKFLMNSYFWDPDEILIYQQKELEKTLRLAVNCCQYYSILTEEMIRHAVNTMDLSDLPIMTKVDIKENFNKLITNNNNLNNFYTSGTTGTPMRISITDSEWAKEYAFVWRQRILLGIKINDKVATFGSRAIITKSNPKSFWRYNFADKQLLFSAYHLQEKNLMKYINKLNNFDCDFVHGFPSLIYTVARYAIENNVKIKKPKAIITSSEKLLNFQRNTIERAFDSKVYDYYGNMERAGIITECEYGNYHINIESGILEIVGDRFLWTSFINRTTPLIRYDIGDLGELDNNYEKCQCGSFFPILKKFEGRGADVVYTKDNTPLGGAILEHIFKKDLNIKEAQIIQELKGSILINVVPGRGFDKKETHKGILSSIQSRVGDSLDISLEVVDYIAKTENGKFKFIVSKIN